MHPKHVLAFHWYCTPSFHMVNRTIHPHYLLLLWPQRFCSTFQLHFCTIPVSLALSGLSGLSFPITFTGKIHPSMGHLSHIWLLVYYHRNKGFPHRRQMNGCGPLDPALVRVVNFGQLPQVHIRHVRSEAKNILHREVCTS
jgi:hypothetical protein